MSGKDVEQTCVLTGSDAPSNVNATTDSPVESWVNALGEIDAIWVGDVIRLARFRGSQPVS
jgi:hypothetical protein